MIEVYHDVDGEPLAPNGSVLAVGAFDGIHLGHRRLLAEVVARARQLDATPAVISFEPLPRAFFSPQPLPRLASVGEKVCRLHQAGIEKALLLRFNRAFTQMQAACFVRQILVQRMQAKEVWVGGDFHFGHKRQGDFALLEAMGKDLGFAARSMTTVTAAGERASSSCIRQWLGQGALDKAATMLGRPFSMSGKVIYGQQLGRQLGYPTANIPIRQPVSPLNGVFAVKVRVQSQARDYPGVASLGVRPTVNAVERPLLEAHLFDFDGDLYGRRLEVSFVAKLRDEVMFDDIDALVAQIHDDAAEARRILGMKPSQPDL